MRSSALVLGLLLMAPSLALAQEAPGDRITLGDDAVVGTGELVNDVVTLGGDAVIDGEVAGSVLTMGGDVLVTGHVLGDLVTFGGDADIAPGATVSGEISTMGGELRSDGAPLHVSAPHVTHLEPATPLDSLAAFLHSMLEGAVSFALLFFLGLAMIGTVPDRFHALKVVVAREPVHVGLRGAGALVLAALAAILLVITILGIPAALALVIAVSLAGYAGLAAVAAVIGAILPIERLKDRPVQQLAAGVVALYVASLVPGAGGFALAVAALVGLGAVIRTRLGKEAPPSLGVTDGGPYRGAAYPETV